MSDRRLFKPLLKKFKWSFLFLFSLTFLTHYLSFLIRFNLRTNLSFNDSRGRFYYLFGEYPLLKDGGQERYVDWVRLLLFLFLLYFPVKIIIQLTLNYFQKYYERKVNVYLSKKLLDFSCKEKEIMIQKSSEKIYILNNTIPDFGKKFFAIPVNLFGIFTDILLETFSLCFLIKTRYLVDLVPLIVVFILVNLVWFTLFNYFAKKVQEANRRKRIDYQRGEKKEIKVFLENLNVDSKRKSLGQLYNLLDDNSKKLSFLSFNALFFSLLDLIIPGTAILFLFLYYQFWLGGVGGLGWNEYFLAYSFQRIFLKAKRGLDLLPIFFSLQDDCKKIESFFY